jgi:hypothetical protein
MIGTNFGGLKKFRIHDRQILQTECDMPLSALEPVS